MSENNAKTFARSESVSEESYSDQLLKPNRKSSASVDSMVWAKNGSNFNKLKQRNSADGSDIEKCIFSETNNGGRHLRQYSDSLVDSAKSVTRADFHEPVSNENEARDAITRLEPRGPFLCFHRSSTPSRSASFGQADFNQGVNLQLFLTHN